MKNYKLLPVAQAVASLLEKKFGHKANFQLDVQKDWLVIPPIQQVFAAHWNFICDTYYQLVDRKWSLENRLKTEASDIEIQSLKLDIYFEEPYNFIFEFDEPKHFCQYRLIPLKNNEVYSRVSLDYIHYIQLCEKRFVEPGISGYQKLKFYDPLFPEMYNGREQDNRPRQRAFHDLLIDLIPLERPGLNPTMRVPADAVQNKIKDFGPKDCSTITDYIESNNFLDRIVI